MRFSIPSAVLVISTLTPAQTPPFPSQETLRYSVNWPSGLSLGEGQFSANKLVQARQWEFKMTLEAAVPGFEVKDQHRALAGEDFCSAEFEREFVHGKRRSREKTTYHGQKGVATRQTIGGGKSELSVGPCARDALTFLYFVRKELAQGRVPPAQTIYFGGPYQIRLEYKGAQVVTVSETRTEADRVVVSVKGAASQFGLELFFARDAARTPLLARVPLAMGVFSMELVR